MVDGRKLGFMEQTDIYSLFGNILDNAIESVGGLAEEKRFLDLRISVKNAFLCISAENYCENEPRFAEGLPVTTKEDKAYHGFGVRSMSAVVKKYGGEICFSYKDHLFSVTIFFPIR